MGSPPPWYNVHVPYEYHKCFPLRWWLVSAPLNQCKSERSQVSGQQREHVGVTGQTAHSCIRISSETLL